MSTENQQISRIASGVERRGRNGGARERDRGGDVGESTRCRQLTKDEFGDYFYVL
jgi:hypothetical protein